MATEAVQQDPFMQLLMGYLGGQQSGTTGGTKTGTTSSSTSSTTSQSGTQSTQNTADVAKLTDVYNQLVAGPTTDQINSIFATGSKEIPVLQSAYAQAAGLKTANNSVLESQLGDLNARMASSVVDKQISMLGQAGTVAQQIASLTGGSTTTSSGGSTTTGTTDGSSKDVSTGSSDTSSTLNQDSLLKWLVGGQLTGALSGNNNTLSSVIDLIKSGGSKLSDLISGTGNLTIDTSGIGVDNTGAGIGNLLKQFDSSQNVDWSSFDFGA